MGSGHGAEAFQLATRLRTSSCTGPGRRNSGVLWQPFHLGPDHVQELMGLTNTFRGRRHRGGSIKATSCSVTAKPGPLVRGSPSRWYFAWRDAVAPSRRTPGDLGPLDGRPSAHRAPPTTAVTSDLMQRSTSTPAVAADVALDDARLYEKSRPRERRLQANWDLRIGTRRGHATRGGRRLAHHGDRHRGGRRGTPRAGTAHGGDFGGAGLLHGRPGRQRGRSPRRPDLPFDGAQFDRHCLDDLAHEAHVPGRAQPTARGKTVASLSRRRRCRGARSLSRPAADRERDGRTHEEPLSSLVAGN